MGRVFLIAIALLIPVLTVATSLVNWLITLMIRPRILPKLDFKDEIPDQFQTLVVIPALITSCEDIDSLAHQLELHYLRNPEPGLLFALLTDFSDADKKSCPKTRPCSVCHGGDRDIECQIRIPSPTNNNGDSREMVKRNSDPGRYQALLLPSSKAVVEPVRGKVDGLGAQARQAA